LSLGEILWRQFLAVISLGAYPGAATGLFLGLSSWLVIAFNEVFLIVKIIALVFLFDAVASYARKIPLLKSFFGNHAKGFEERLSGIKAMELAMIFCVFIPEGYGLGAAVARFFSGAKKWRLILCLALGGLLQTTMYVFAGQKASDLLGKYVGLACILVLFTLFGLILKAFLNKIGKEIDES
jgi:hypothetical protein